MQSCVSRHVWLVKRIFLTLLATVAGFLPGVTCHASEVPEPKAVTEKAKVVVIPIREQIAKPELYILRRGLKEAIDMGVDTVILDMETPGGRSDVTFDMLKALEKFPGKTVTYINREAMSAGALISAGTDEIYFAPKSVIGAAAPVMGNGQEIETTMNAKLVSYLRARVRAMSEGKGYRGEVVSAMIDKEYELKIGDEVIKPKGELLSLTAQEAMKTYGDPAIPLLGSGVADDIEALLDQLHGKGNHTVERLEITWSEKLAQYMTSVTPILLGLGILLLFIEFKTPGFGIFGIGGLTLMGIVFFSQFVAGLSGHEPALFFALGVILIAVELIFFPGVIIPAATGALLMLGSLVWAMADLWPGEPLTLSGDIFMVPLMNVAVALVIAVILFALILRFLPNGGLWGKMVLDAVVGGEPGARVLGSDAVVLAGGSASSLVGETGVAVTPLYPSGQVEIAGRRYEAKLSVGYADSGSRIHVIGVGEFGLTVEVLS